MTSKNRPDTLSSTMSCFTEAIRAHLQELGEEGLYEALVSTYGDLVARRVPHIDYPKDGRTNLISRLKFNCAVCQQSLLHRAIRLFEGALCVLADSNVYALALCVRAHFETAATLGYLHKRVTSYIEGSIPLSALDDDIFGQLLGCRHKPLPMAPDPKNIMTQLDYADKVVDKELLAKHGSSRRALLREDYEFLSEFCHPNYHSNTLAYDVDKARDRFVFRYDGAARRNERSLVGYLDISNPLFVWFFDEFEAAIPLIKEDSGENRQV